MRAALTVFMAAFFLVAASASGYATGFGGHHGQICKKIVIKYPIWRASFRHHHGGFVTKTVTICFNSASP